MIVLRHDGLEVTVLPEVGGKIAQIRHSESGRNLLVSPSRPHRTISSGGDWTTHDLSGMDDCFPTIASVPPFPALGEWVTGQWNVASFDDCQCRLDREGELLNYRASKRIELEEGCSLRIEYSVTNRGSDPFPYIWAAHPLFEAGPQFEIGLPAGDIRFRLYPGDGRLRRWPDFGGIGLSKHWLENVTTLKTFLAGLSEGWCELRLPTHTVRLEFDLDTHPFLGVWFNNFGFPSAGTSPFRCIALEPCTSPSDALGALDAGQPPSIAPGQTVNWSIRLSATFHRGDKNA